MEAGPRACCNYNLRSLYRALTLTDVEADEPDVMQDPQHSRAELNAVAVSADGLVSRGKPTSGKGSQDIQVLLDNVQSSSSPEQKRQR